ncbi:MAG: translocation/assembly module TamB domain-containing protein [Polyangiaceae bacterium]|nr:translocation/assembly module TamB domain-containing protein [Polyangiaceae bacterium]
MAGHHARSRQPRRGWGRHVARALCALFAVLGAAPVALLVAVDTGTAQRLLQRETAEVLERLLGVRARYSVGLRLWPLQAVVSDLVVPSNDGLGPALTVRRVVVRPKLFALLGGQLSAGNVVIEQPRARLVLRDGALTNVSYRLPKSTSPRKRSETAPFAALRVEGLGVNADIDGIRVASHDSSVTVSAHDGMKFDVVARLGPMTVTATHPHRVQYDRAVPAGPIPTVDHDEDVVCKAEVDVSIENSRLAVHRLELEARADHDPAAGSRPDCSAPSAADPGLVTLRSSGLQLDFSQGKGKTEVAGNVLGRAPVWLANRFVPTLPLTGWVELDGHVRYDAKARLPSVQGSLRGENIGLDVYRIAQTLRTRLDVRDDEIHLPHFEMGFADGLVTLEDAVISPFAPGVPLKAAASNGKNVLFTSLMRDVGVTPHTIVNWDIVQTHASNIHGTLDPVHIDGALEGVTKNFVVYSRGFDDPARRRMIGVAQAPLRGRFGVRPDALEFYDTHITFGSSSVKADLLSIGFHDGPEAIHLVVNKASRLELADIGPLAGIQMSGMAALDADMAGRFGNPLLRGHLKVDRFTFGGFPVGDILSSEVAFRPLKLDLAKVHAVKGSSPFLIPGARFDFDAGATLVVDATARSDALDVRDFLAMWKMETDPRFEPMKALTAVNARLHYALDGPEDACGGGHLQINGSLDVRSAELFGESYDGGAGDFALDWVDRDAGTLGFSLDVPSIVMNKGTGRLVGALSVSPGAVLQGQLTATQVPLSRLDVLGSLASRVDGRVNASIQLGGTLQEMAADARVTVGPIHIGSASLEGSELLVRLVPAGREQKRAGTTRCGRAIPAPFDPVEFAADAVEGVFTVQGELFGGQAKLPGLEITQQRSRSVRGKAIFERLELGALAQLSPTVALSDTPPNGTLSGEADLEQLDMDRPTEAVARLVLSRFGMSYNGFRAALTGGSAELAFRRGTLEIPALALALTTPGGQRAIVDAHGSVSGPLDGARLNLVVGLRKTDLSSLVGDIPGATKVTGTLEGGLHLYGKFDSPEYDGRLELRDGSVALGEFDTSMSDVQLVLKLDEEQLRIARGTALLGGGTLKLSGGAPLRGLSMGTARVVLEARNVTLAPDPGLRTTLDADLVATYGEPGHSDGPGALPRISGEVSVTSFEYTRPIKMTADLSTLAQRGKRTEFDAYDTAEDSVAFDVRLVSAGPLHIRNNLMEAELQLDPEGLRLTGTDQRMGLVGALDAKPGGRIQMRQSEFEIRRGLVRFDDETRIAAQVDVTAVTEYRRYTDSTEEEQATADTGSASATTIATTSGSWRITMHAYGDADELKIDLSSEPPLAQDDIFLLLTVGLTRAELDQARSASVGESVALEALGTLSGADRAVSEALPMIDDFRFGSAYSSRTGRTEPTVTVSKRLADRIRANVTSGLAESRELRSNVEWRLSPRVSVEGSYDNVNDISSSTLGNLGADIRWRLEFE